MIIHHIIALTLPFGMAEIQSFRNGTASNAVGRIWDSYLQCLAESEHVFVFRTGTTGGEI